MIYPVCVVGDAVTCYDAHEVRAWRFCGSEAGANAGGMFTDFPKPLRFVGFRICGDDYCAVVSGYAGRKEIARNDIGAAIATGLIQGEFRDGMEPLDQHNPSTCTFSLVVS